MRCPTHNAGHIDDGAVKLLVLHQAGGGLGHQEGPLQVDVDDPVKVLLLHPQHEAVAGDAGAVDDDVGGPLVLVQYLGSRADQVSFRGCLSLIY